MAQISDKVAHKVRAWYEKDLYSARMIADRLGVSLDAVYYCLRKYHIKRRTAQENNRLTFIRKKSSFRLATGLTRKQVRLKDAGVVLYWCEGYKQKTSQGIDFANSDPFMIKVFLRFLREVCGIDERRLRAYVYCHSNVDIQTLERHWQKVTGIVQSQFTKTYVRQGEESKASRMPYGLIHIRYSDKKLLQMLMSWIEDYKKECVGTQVVNGGAL